MLSHDPPSGVSSELFERAAEVVLSRHDWRLLDKFAVAAQVATRWERLSAPTQVEAERACQQVYAQHLYATVQDVTHREVAYRELHAYLYRIALRQRPELAEDAAQEAILLVYEKLATCRDPSAFLKFAIYQLLTAFHRLTPSQREFSLEGWYEVSGDEAESQWRVAEAPALEVQAAERDEAIQLLRWLHAVITANPRARNQILAVALKYLEGLEEEEIAEMLGTSVANVYVLRNRGLAKLRQEYHKRLSQVQDF